MGVMGTVTIYSVTIYFYFSEYTMWLAWEDSFRTFEWDKAVPVPELAY